MELWDYVRMLRRRWRLALFVPLLAVLATAFVTSQATPQYQSSVKFFVSTPATTADAGAAYTGGLFSQQRVKSYADLLTGPRLRAAVDADLRNANLAVSGYDVTARAQPETVLLTATVTHPDPAAANAVAAAIGREFPKLVDDLESPGPGAPSIRATVVADPKQGTDPVSPRPLRNLALALVVGVLLGLGLAVARDALDRSVSGLDDLRAVTGFAVLGAIAYDNRAAKRPLIVHDDPHAPRAEAFRQLRTNLRFVQVDRPLTSVVVTSSLPGEGKSTSACNLAITLAQAGMKVLLLEADLRRPKIPGYLGIEGGVGLTSVLIGQAAFDEVVQHWGEFELDVLSSGPLPPNPSELLSSAGMRDLLATLERRYDIVVVDAPPLLPVTDAAILATMTSGALVCVQVGRVRREQVRRSAETLAAVDAVVLGAVMTMVPRRGADPHHGYGYGYKYAADRTMARLDGEAALDAVRREPGGESAEPVPDDEPPVPAVTAPDPEPPPSAPDHSGPPVEEEPPSLVRGAAPLPLIDRDTLSALYDDLPGYGPPAASPPTVVVSPPAGAPNGLVDDAHPDSRPELAPDRRFQG